MPRILVVDDDRLIRALVAAIFEMQGVDCVTAASGEEALTRVASGEFDLVLLDLMMPGLDGFAVLDALPRPHPPVMIATAAVPSVVGRVPMSRIDAILQKPFDVDELIATARELLARNQPAALPRAGARPLPRTDLRIQPGEPLPPLRRPPLRDPR